MTKEKAPEDKNNDSAAVLIEIGEGSYRLLHDYTSHADDEFGAGELLTMCSTGQITRLNARPGDPAFSLFTIKNMSKLSKQHPEIADWIIKHGKDVHDWDMDAAICEALFSIEENGHYEMPVTTIFSLSLKQRPMHHSHSKQ